MRGPVGELALAIGLKGGRMEDVRVDDRPLLAAQRQLGKALARRTDRPRPRTD